MALIKCKECGRDVSENAVTCPHCGIQLISASDYEMKTVTLTCWGMVSGKKSLEKKLKKFQDEGWEVVSYNHINNNASAISFTQGYTVVLRRLKKR